MTDSATLIHPMQLGGLSLPHNLALAPMHKRTNLAFRLMARRWGAAFTYTEMAVPEDLLDGRRHRGGNRRRGGRLLASTPEDRPLGVQILPVHAGPLVEAIAMIAETGAGDLIDLNFACPSKKVAGIGVGAAFLRKPEAAVDLVKAAVAASRLPVTLKMRYGYTDAADDRRRALDLARAAVAAGAAAITLHARSAVQGYDERAAWERIAEWVEALAPVPVFGSGDLATPEAIMEMLRATGAAGVSIARGSVGAPWIFRQTLDLAATGAYQPVTPAERGRVFLEHFEALLAAVGEADAVRFLCHTGRMYAVDIPAAREAQAAIYKARSRDALYRVAAQYFGPGL